MKSEEDRENTWWGLLRETPLLPGLLALMLLLAVATSCSGESVVGARDIGPDTADLSLLSDMLPGEDVRPASDLGDTPEDAGNTPTPDAAGDMGVIEDASQDMAPEPWPIWDCTCEDPLAVCYIRWCARPDLMCDPSAEPDPCPEGYGCSQRGYCTCHSEERNGCAPRCNSDADCGSRLVCNRFRGICVDPLPCRNDTECGEGTYCIRPDDDPNGKCGELGTLAVGEACSRAHDCRSGMCSWGMLDEAGNPTQRCKQTCLRDADCLAGEECRFGNPRAYCEPRSTRCPISCGVDERCIARSDGTAECRPSFCRWTQDCTEGDCIAFPGLYAQGSCDSGRTEKLCKRTEFRTHPDDPYCRLTPCAARGDCAAPYECLPPHGDFPVPGAFCSRPVTLDCDQPHHTGDMGRSACPADMGL